MGRRSLLDYAVVGILLVAGLLLILALEWPGVIVGPIQLAAMLVWFKVLKTWKDP